MVSDVLGKGPEVLPRSDIAGMVAHKPEPPHHTVAGVNAGCVSAGKSGE